MLTAGNPGTVVMAGVRWFVRFFPGLGGPGSIGGLAAEGAE